MTRPPRSRDGFTLLELLGVLAILGLVAATLAPSLASATGRSAGFRLRAAILEMDARARILARRLGPIELALVEGELALTARRTGASLQALRLGPGASLQLAGPDAKPRVEYDELGRSADFTFRLADEAGAERVWRVAGLTGWNVEVLEP